ncbi:MAG: adenine nucleotide alpha hydrolase [Pseudomonadota bacterium]
MTTILESDTCLKSLQRVLEQHGQLAIAVSGGVDSMTLAVIACRLNSATVVFHALSPAVPDLGTARVRAYAERFNWQLHEIDAGEMDDPDYRRNPGNRCYYCKSNLYTSIRRHTNLMIASGTNLDDLDDYRPGLIAAAEQQIIHPLVEARINKMAVRQLATMAGLQELSELPASPCLSSRVTTGIAIDADLLPLIDQTEEAIRKLFHHKSGGENIRCRIRNAGITIQLDDSTAIQPEKIRAAVQQIFSNTRFAHYSAHISIEPYQQGSAFIRVMS